MPEVLEDKDVDSYISQRKLKSEWREQSVVLYTQTLGTLTFEVYLVVHYPGLKP
jgi:hypothetical protein